MLVDILIAITMNLAMYIIVSTINGRESKATQNYIKYELDRVQVLLEKKAEENKLDMIRELKQQGELSRKDE